MGWGLWCHIGRCMDETTDNQVRLWPCCVMHSIAGQCVSLPQGVSVFPSWWMLLAWKQGQKNCHNTMIAALSLPLSFFLPLQFHPNSPRNWPLVYIPKARYYISALVFYPSPPLLPSADHYTHLIQPPTATHQLMGLFTRCYNLINSGGNNFRSQPVSSRSSTKTKV